MEISSRAAHCALSPAALGVLASGVLKTYPAIRRDTLQETLTLAVETPEVVFAALRILFAQIQTSKPPADAKIAGLLDLLSDDDQFITDYKRQRYDLRAYPLHAVLNAPLRYPATLRALGKRADMQLGVVPTTSDLRIIALQDTELLFDFLAAFKKMDLVFMVHYALFMDTERDMDMAARIELLLDAGGAALAYKIRQQLWEDSTTALAFARHLHRWNSQLRRAWCQAAVVAQVQDIDDRLPKRRHVTSPEVP